MKNRYRLMKRMIVSVFLIAVLLLFTSACKFANLDYMQKKVFYPLFYQEYIKEYSTKNNLQPWFVASIMKNESGFKTEVISPSGAIGLMQIMPETGSWIAKELYIEQFTNSMLKEPKINIRFGCWYLSELEYEFGKEKVVIAAYNAGRGQVREWIEEGIWDGDDIEQIPFKETREYVKRVLKDKGKYETLYQDVWSSQ